MFAGVAGGGGQTMTWYAATKMEKDTGYAVAKR